MNTALYTIKTVLLPVAGIMYRPGNGNEDSLVSGKSATTYDDFTYCVGGEYSFEKSYTTPDQRNVSFKVILILKNIC